MTHHDAAVEICELLLRLPSPKHAARAIAIVRSNLWVAGGAETTDDVRKMIAEDDDVALQIWQAVHAKKN